MEAVSPSTQVDVAVLGAGAAGLMAAATAGARGRRTLLLDHADRAGKKILISGGGRCNFTNLGCRAENFVSENPHFAKSALAAYPPEQFIALVERHRIRYHEKTLGQLFCDTSSREIVVMLEAECLSARVETRLNATIDTLARTSAGFELQTSAGLVRAHSVIVATGGLSIPRMGATGLGYELARQFGIAIVPCRPALVPFTFSPADRDAWCELAGASAEAILTTRPRNRRTRPPGFREKVLITHRGLSGPAALQISSYWPEGDTIEADLAPGRDVFAPLLAPKARRDLPAALTALKSILPTRWAERWLDLQPAPASRDLSNADLARMEAALHRWTLRPAGTEGYAKAEVTAGGISTAELHAGTLESRQVPGLFFIGEVVDVTGWLGGYNFQWAWASGVAAGTHA